MVLSPYRPKVLLRRCESYDVEKIRNIVREGLEELGLRPRGRTLLKPNVVASGPLFPHAYTRPEFVEGVALALRDRDEGEMAELAVGERSGITIPTRTAFDAAGYYPMLRRARLKRYHFEEERQVEIPLTHARRLRDYLYAPEPVAKADFFVNCPKFKSHPWTTVTFCLKNYIGLQDDRHRMVDHDHRLNEKVRDLQYILQPQFCAVDAIVAGEGRMLTPQPVDLGLIVLGNNQVAVDAVCSRLIGVEPRTVEHLRLVEEEGFGPTDLADIELGGDVTLAEGQARARGFRVGLVRVEKYFEGTQITAYAGPPPERERTDYCWGGCPGAIEEAIEVLRLFDTECDAKLPRIHVVFGAYDGPIDRKPGEKVVFIGDCANYHGRVGEETIAIENLYRPRAERDPHDLRHEDIYKKMFTVATNLATSGDVIRLRGCPVSVAEQVLALVTLGGLKNPYFSPTEIVKFNRGYLAWKSAVLFKRLRGKSYQTTDPVVRGAAAAAPEAAQK